MVITAVSVFVLWNIRRVRTSRKTQSVSLSAHSNPKRACNLQFQQCSCSQTFVMCSSAQLAPSYSLEGEWSQQKRMYEKALQRMICSVFATPSHALRAHLVVHLPEGFCLRIRIQFWLRFCLCLLSRLLFCGCLGLGLLSSFLGGNLLLCLLPRLIL